MKRDGLTDAPTVLVVEDELIIRVDIANCLQDAGFEVVEAANADDAISILESRNDIRLVFTDVDMPGSMDGLKLASFVRDRWPPIKLIVTSGHVPAKEADLPSGGRFFTKPYRGVAGRPGNDGDVARLTAGRFEWLATPRPGALRHGDLPVFPSSRRRPSCPRGWRSA
jgi:two-component system, response regulator PdtaR